MYNMEIKRNYLILLNNINILKNIENILFIL